MITNPLTQWPRQFRRLALVFATAAVSLATSSRVFAQAKDTVQLGTVVVSATKVPKPAATLSQAVTVLLGDDLRARGITRVTDALREVPGASMVQTGSFGGIRRSSSAAVRVGTPRCSSMEWR